MEQNLIGGKIMNKFEIKKVNRYTRASHDGKRIVCKCNAAIRVFHFSWSAIKCVDCGQDIKKEDWTIGLQTSKNINGSGKVVKDIKL